MKILLTTLNSKYIHSNLALRYLREACPGEQIQLQEYTINDRLESVVGDIYRSGADIIGFSCYIWNITQTLQITQLLRKVSPETIIILGGPEVSYDPLSYLKWTDYVVVGEGEKTFPELLAYINKSRAKLAAGEPGGILGLAYNSAQGPVFTGERELISDLSSLVSPYTSLDGMENKIAYIESSRGCPFNCQYCLSSTLQGVRFFPLERTKIELQRLIDSGIKQVKFVDRTFNCNKSHALELLSFIKDWHPEANFHFEISADLLDQEQLDFLKDMPPGLIQFEVGVQSTNRQTLEIIDRKTDLAKLAANVKQISAQKNIHQLLDLIAGLPKEDYQSFRNSFNEVFSWGPDKLHLGFLKLLKGSGIRARAETGGYIFSDLPPYQVLANQWMNFGELLKLQQIEDMVDKYYNSGRFSHTLKFLVAEASQDAFGLFEDLAQFWEDNNYHRQAHKARALYTALWEFYRYKQGTKLDPLFAELLKLDFLLQEKPANLPDWSTGSEPLFFKERAASFMHQGLLRLMPQLKDHSKREINKHFHLEHFSPNLGEYLGLPLMGEGDEPLYLLFYYPGQLINAKQPGFIPVVI